MRQPFGRPAAARRSPRPNRAEKKNDCPTHGTLDPDRPFIKSTSRWQTARPRPVPPYCREVLVSPCSNGMKIASSFSAAMPMPVSRTVKSRVTSSSSHRRPALAERLRRGREFGGIADQVDDHLPQPARVADQHGGKSRPSTKMGCVRLLWTQPIHRRAEFPAVLIGDPGRLRQVIVNLVGNATKFTVRGEVVLRVQAVDVTDDDVTLLFTVRDTGIGIAAEKLEAIFMPFEQGDTSTSRQYGGTGLGLAVCQRLVDLMNGRVWVESAVGLGSSFFFSARFGRGEPPGRSRAAERLTHLAGLSVLVVDDNATSGAILTSFLGEWGLEPRRCETESVAVAALTQARDAGCPYSLVFLDTDMPGTDSYALMETLARPGHPPVVLLTALDRWREQERYRELGAAAGLVKPVVQSELFKVLDELRPARGKRLSAVKPVATAAPPRPLCVLIAEDNPINQRLAAKLLEKQGHAVALAANGREAIDAWPSRAIRPDPDGRANARGGRFRRDTGDPRMRERHGRTHPDHRPDGAHLAGRPRALPRSGMDAYVTKPIRPEELAEAMAAATSV